MLARQIPAPTSKFALQADRAGIVIQFGVDARQEAVGVNGRNVTRIAGDTIKTGALPIAETVSGKAVQFEVV